MAILSVKQVSFQYPKQSHCLDTVDLQLEPGQITTILGPNGVGKSTLLKLMSGLLQPKSGTVLLNDTDFAQFSPAQRAQTIALVPQLSSAAVLPYTVLDYLLLGKSAQLGLFGQPGKQDYQSALTLLDQFNCADLKDQPCRSLSGGQLQLVMVAKALMQQPQILLLDEPTAALDYRNQKQILKLLQQLRQQGLSIVLTSHDPNQAILLEDRVALLHPNGRLEVGKMADMVSTEKLTQVYDTQLQVEFVPSCQRLVCSLRL